MHKRILFLFSLIMLGSFGWGVAQTASLQIKQTEKIDSLFQLKIQWDRETFENSYYTIQLHYGSLEKAKEIEAQFQEIFPHIPTDLSFETPNYKVQSGQYNNVLYAEKTLDSIKPHFPSAFLLKRKKKL